MKLHNIMEEYVEDKVRDIYRKLVAAKSPWLKCACENCILNATAFVLNRSGARYVVSTHASVSATQLLNDRQLSADIDALAIEAVRTINSVTRPGHKMYNGANGIDTLREAMPSYNFPVITGACFDGNTFEAINGAVVVLKNEKGIVAMQDQTWENPAQTFKATNGSFNFWPQSVMAQKVGQLKKFTFVAEASAPGYQNAIQTFDVTLESEPKMRTFISNSVAMKMSDFVLFNEYD